MLHANEQKYKQRRQQESSHRNTCLSECWKLLVIEHHWPYLPRQTNDTFQTRSILDVLCVWLYTDRVGQNDSIKTERLRREIIEDVWNKSTIMDKSPGTNLHFWRFYAHVRRRIQHHLPSVASIPNTMLKTTTCNFFWFSALYRLGRGRVTRF